jgi:hypothetical protein
MARPDSATPALGDSLEEAALGATAPGRAANVALRSFSKAARAFTLYEAQNEAVRRFLQEYRDAMAAFLSAHGALDLEVRPFELTLRGEIVHTEKDREKSLAYRLHRDGVRRLTVKPSATWQEQLKLLEVLSVRFIGVRQQEEDAVTLLTRAAFRHISFTAAAGLVAAESDEPAAPPQRPPVRAFPADFDGAAPPLLPPRILGFFPIPASSLEGFAAEETAGTLPGNAVRMIRELLDDANEVELKTLVPAVEEVRDFLLCELDIEHLRDLAKVVAGQHGKAAVVLGPSLCPLAAPHALQRLLDTVPHGEPAPDALIELLDKLSDYGADLFDPLCDRMGAALGTNASGYRSLETLLARAARGKKDAILARLGSAEPALLDLLLKVLREQEPAALPQAFDVLHEGLVSREASGLDAKDAESMGSALGALDPARAREVFDAWLHPPQTGLLSKLMGAKPKRMLAWAAVAGLTFVPGEPTQRLLRELAADADEELKSHCMKSFSLWRRRGASADG